MKQESTPGTSLLASPESKKPMPTTASKPPPKPKQTTAGSSSPRDTPQAPSAEFTANVLTNGTCNAMVVKHYLPSVNGGGNLEELARVTAVQAATIGKGDLAQLEMMLLSQATALQAMFTDLALRARGHTQIEVIQTMTNLAIKCASQSRQAITALAELKIPKSVVFAKQLNQAQGHQQVNNVTNAVDPVAYAVGKAIPEIKLFGGNHEKTNDRLDRGAQAAPARGHTTLEAMEQVNRAKNPGGQGKGLQKRRQGP